MLTIKKLEKKHIPESLKIITETRVTTNRSEVRWLMDLSIKKSDHDLKPAYYVLLDNDKVVGISGLYQDYEDPKTVRWLDYLAVMPGLQRRGYGTKMFKNLENVCRKQKVKIICVFTDNQKAINFYKKNKLKVFGKIKNYFPHAAKVWLYKKL